MQVRLIDANKLMLRLQKKESTFFDRRQTEGFNDAILRVRSMVHSEKTVDPESLPIVQELRAQLANSRPVVYGEWIFTKRVCDADECNCSICGQILTTHAGDRMDFCPNCGADMRGKPNKEEE